MGGMGGRAGVSCGAGELVRRSCAETAEDDAATGGKSMDRRSKGYDGQARGAGLHSV